MSRPAKKITGGDFQKSLSSFTNRAKEMSLNELKNVIAPKKPSSMASNEMDEGLKEDQKLPHQLALSKGP
jgi:hypothetical protein